MDLVFLYILLRSRIVDVDDNDRDFTLFSPPPQSPWDSIRAC